MSESKAAPCAADFMTLQVHFVTPEMSLGDVVQFLLQHKISNAPVVDQQNGKKLLVGFISEQDCLVFLSNEAFFGSPAPPQTAQTIMRMHPVCVAPDTELFTLASIFASHGYRHVPVVENGELVGVVSRRDIMKAMDAHYRNSTKQRDEQRFPPDLGQIINHRFVVSDR